MIGEIHNGDCIEIMSGWPDGCVDCCVTSPPYWGLRDYGHDQQIGLEESPAEYIAKMVAVFEQVRRVLKDEGTLWLNVGDSYAVNRGYQVKDGKHTDVGNTMGMAVPDGLKPKDLCMIPARLAIALCDAGWYLRSEIIWHKPNPMPESVKDRPTSSHEKIYLLAKSQRYWYDADAIAIPAAQNRWGGKKPSNVANSKGDFRGLNRDRDMMPEVTNARNVWTIPTKPYSAAHFAVFPPELPRRCILAGCPPGGVVLDPFFGSGTTGMVAEQLGRQWVGIELNPEYITLARKRTQQRGIFT